MPDGILIIDKPADWTSMDVCAPQMQASAGTPDFMILGGSEFRLRQGFAAGKTLARRKSAGAWRMGGITWLTAF